LLHDAFRRIAGEWSFDTPVNQEAVLTTMDGCKRVVVTGMGAVTPVGITVAKYWEAICAGKNGAAYITTFDTTDIGCKIAAPVKDFDPEAYLTKKDAKRIDRFAQFAMVAAREAMQDAGIVVDESNRDRIGVMVGCGIGGLSTLEEQVTVLNEKGPKRVSALLIPRIITNIAAGHVSIDLGVRGPNSCAVTACATGTHNIGDAMHIIKRGEADAMIAGGCEAAITPLGVSGFSNMQALTTRNDDPEHASRPYDRDRDGFLMGEGAGIVVLEELESARKRGAHIYAELIGYGMSGDAFHMTAPDPEGDGGKRCFEAAMRSARVNPEDVDYINSHGTSTPLNDKLETLAIKKAFGDHARKLSISSVKSMIGHLLGAAGGVEAIASCMTLQTGIIPPTINYTTPDPECDLDYTPNTARESNVKIAMSNNLGFGGHNCAIVLRKFEG
jgi:3-oxoacyl-[acyl-carrier-protein] synthase II